MGQKWPVGVPGTAEQTSFHVSSDRGAKGRDRQKSEQGRCEDQHETQKENLWGWPLR